MKVFDQKSVAKHPSPCSQDSVVSEVNSVLNLNMNKSEGPVESRVQGSDAVSHAYLAIYDWICFLAFGFEAMQAEKLGAIQKSLEQSRKALHYNGFKAIGVGAEWIWVGHWSRWSAFDMVFSKQDPGFNKSVTLQSTEIPILRGWGYAATTNSMEISLGLRTGRWESAIESVSKGKS